VGKPGLRKVHRYSAEFKLTAVKLRHMPGVEVQTVAHLALALAEGSAGRRGQGAEPEGGHTLAISPGDQATPGAQARARDAEG